MRKLLLTTIAVILSAFALASCTGGKTLELKTVVDSVYMTAMNGDEDWLSDIDQSTLTTVYGMDFTNIEEVYGKAPTMNVQASAIIGVKAKKDMTKDAIAELQKYKDVVISNFDQYLPEQYEIAKAGTIVESGDYVFLIIAEDTNKAVEVLKTHF